MKSLIQEDVVRFKISDLSRGGKIFQMFTVGLCLSLSYGCLGQDLPRIEDGPGVPEYIYSVQVGAETDSEIAETKKARASESGIIPVVVNYQAPYYKVLAGEVDSYPEAMVLRNELLASGFSGSFIQKSANTTSKTVSKEFPNPKSFLDLSKFPSRSAINDIDLSALSGVSLKEEDFQGRTDFEKLSRDVEPLFSQRADSDPLKGFYLYYYALAVERCDPKTNLQTARDLYKQIALGTISSPAGYRKKALLQFADSLHYYKRDFFAAYCTYNIILKLDWYTPEEKAPIWAELAGTYLELLDSGDKGNPIEVRKKLSEIYASIPAEFVKYRAVVELIYSETWFWEKKETGLPKAIDYAKIIQEKYSSLPQIYSQAIWNEAAALDRQDRKEEALTALLRGYGVSVSPVESFRTRKGVWNVENRYDQYIHALEKRMDTQNILPFKPTAITSDEQSTRPLNTIVPGMP